MNNYKRLHALNWCRNSYSQSHNTKKSNEMENINMQQSNWMQEWPLEMLQIVDVLTESNGIGLRSIET